jgi:membrane-bound lytic murein transglycosylase A
MSAAWMLLLLLPSAARAGSFEALRAARETAAALAPEAAPADLEAPRTPVLEDPLDSCLRKLDKTTPGKPAAETPPLAARWIGPVALPPLDDDASRASLAEAARRTAAYWDANPGETIKVAGRTVSAKSLALASRELARLADSVEPSAWPAAISARFEVFESSAATGEPGRATGYYTPTIPLVPRLSTAATAVLARPGDLGSRVPYFSFRQIMDGALDGRGLELYGTAHAADLWSLQLEGSGWGALAGGRRVFLGEAGVNGRPFRSVSRSLQFCGIVPDVMGQPELMAWLKALPPARERKAVSLNPRYVFFEEIPGGAPTGAIGVVLTPARSIAVDKRVFPLGLPALLIARRPAPGLAAPGSEVPFARLVFAHDVGGAIGGGARADLYFGDDESGASGMSSPARLFVLLPKN